jgi:hypothetical protein
MATKKPQKPATVTKSYSISTKAARLVEKLARESNRTPSNYIDTLILEQSKNAAS